MENLRLPTDVLDPLIELGTVVSYQEVLLNDIPAQHPVRLFSDFWMSNKSDSFVPLRGAIEPTKIPAILPWLLLLEVIEIENKQQFRYRLTGTGCRELFGIDFTGKLLGEGLTQDGADARFREFGKVVETSQVVYSSSKLPIADRSFLNVYRGVFPVSTNGYQVNQIFVVIAHEELALDQVRQPARPHALQARSSIY